MNEVFNVAQPRRRFLHLAAMTAAATASPRLLRAGQRAEGELPSSEAMTTFDEVWRTVRDRFYDPRLHGLDWSAVHERFAAEAERLTSEQALARLINNMLAELQASHTHYYTPDDPAYYQLAGIFAGALRRRGLERAFPGARVSYPGIGILSRMGDQGNTTVTGVIEGTPAHRAGLLSGDEIIAADGVPFQPVQSFQGKIGMRVVLELRRAGAALQIPVTPADIEPNKMFLDGMKASARILRSNGRRIGYVHVWSYAGYAYQRALEQLISEGVLREADALIWDLRDGWGGAIPEYLDLFNPRAPTMRVTDRDGAIAFENVKWRKPVAMLVNQGTRSGKEVLAYGFKKYGLGEVIGTRTEGAVLAATAFLIGKGLLLLAVQDVLVDGERLEGVGVEPTIEVRAGPVSGGGDDAQLNRAIAVLSSAG